METLDNPIEFERPQFLKVLCILSFIGCGIMIVVGLFGLKNLFMSVEELASDPGMMQLQQMSQDSYDIAVKGLQYKNINAIFGLLTPVLSLIGVVMMWQLKKPGFILYVFAEILPYVLLTFTAGYKSLTAMGGMMENFQPIIYAVMIMVVVFDIAFIIMYAMNLKYMK